MVIGVVRDETPDLRLGDPVPHAAIALTYRGASAPSQSASTGSDGTFQIPGVRSGEAFQLAVTKGGYSARVRDVSAFEANGALEIGISPVPVTFSGTVTDRVTGVAVPGAQVEVLTGTRKGASALADQKGEFTIPSMWGDFSFAVSRLNYEPETADVQLANNSRVSVRLAPVERLVRTTFAGDLCTSVQLPSYLSCSAPKEQHHSLELNRPATVRVSTEYRYVGDYYPNYLSVELRCGSELVRPAWVVSPSESAVVQLPRACNYDLRLFNFIADTKGGAQTTYRVVIEHPQQ